MPMVKLLLDTNVVIELEDPNPTPSRAAKFAQYCESYGLRRVVCDANCEDISKDQNPTRRKTTVSKLDKYPRLENLPTSDNVLVERFGPNLTNNDYRDMKLLGYLLIGSADLLVSEDIALKKRAEKAGIGNRVLDIPGVLDWIQRTYIPEEVSLPYIEEMPAYQVNIQDPLFNSIRDDYAEFNEWFRQKCVKEDRLCWIVKIGGQMAGIAIRKDEKPEEAVCLAQAKHILKICTLKVSDEFSGEKLGEQLLKQILWWAARNQKEVVYLTTYLKQKKLINLLVTYGFQSTHILKTQEKVFEKELVHGNLSKACFQGDPLAYARRIYPRYYDGEASQKFIIPIRPKYHSILFPELHLAEAQQIDLFRPPGPRTPGNTIGKVYICRSNTKLLRLGDLIFFYVSKNTTLPCSQVITSLGVVERVTHAKNLEELIRATAGRSVYSKDQLDQYLSERNTPMMVIDFLLAPHLERSIPLSTLVQKQIISSAPQSITRLESAQYTKLSSFL